MNTPSFRPLRQPWLRIADYSSRITHYALRITHYASRTCPLFLCCCLLLPFPASAFPPAPDHTFYGMVRDEMGDPIVVTNAQVILETLAGTQVTTWVVPFMSPGENYTLTVPMDAGLTADAYKPTALQPTVAFRMKVMIGQVTYLPIELHGNYANLGKPAQRTHLDLTLGEDANNDGIPDAWEQMLADILGIPWQDIKPGDDADGDGLTNLQEYLAGTYAFDPEDGFRLDLVGVDQDRPVMDFLAIRGRTYTLYGTTDLQAWVPLQFRVGDANAAPVSSYAASDSRILRIEAEVSARSPMVAFKAKVQ